MLACERRRQSEIICIRRQVKCEYENKLIPHEAGGISRASAFVLVEKPNVTRVEKPRGSLRSRVESEFPFSNVRIQWWFNPKTHWYTDSASYTSLKRIMFYSQFRRPLDQNCNKVVQKLSGYNEASKILLYSQGSTKPGRSVFHR